MRALAFLAVFPVVCLVAVAGEAQRPTDKRPTKTWNRKGPLGETPKRVTDAFRTPTEKKHWSVGDVWEAPWRFADDYHVFGLDWTEEEIRYYVDGVLVRSVENTHWRQPLYLIFDSETMPQWFGMPDDRDLPSTFSVEYVRAWKRT